MGFCEECGTKLNEGEKFCWNCGKAIPTGQNDDQNSRFFLRGENKETANENIEVTETAKKTCTNCGKDLMPEWVICPFCKTETGPKLCTCGKELDREWLVCPYCKADV